MMWDMLLVKKCLKVQLWIGSLPNFLLSVDTTNTVSSLELAWMLRRSLLSSLTNKKNIPLKIVRYKHWTENKWEKQPKKERKTLKKLQEILIKTAFYIYRKVWLLAKYKKSGLTQDICTLQKVWGCIAFPKQTISEIYWKIWRWTLW